jgi:hypothetical protein
LTLFANTFAARIFCRTFFKIEPEGVLFMLIRFSALFLSGLVLASCGAANRDTQSSVSDLPSKDAGVAALRSQFASAGAISSLGEKELGKKYRCALFSALKDISHNALFELSFEKFGPTYVSTAYYNTNNREFNVVGTLTPTHGRLVGTSTGRNDRFVLPYGPLGQEIRRAADGSIIGEAFVAGEEMIMDEKFGLSLATLLASQWTEPSVSRPAQFAFHYFVCK